MNTLKLIYNPNSGDKQFKHSLDACVKIFQDAGYETHLLRATSPAILDKAAATMDEDVVIAAGGDGTVNLIVNALKRHDKDVPLGIIPAGTANDFANFLKMPKDPVEAAQAIIEGRIMKSDLGLVNGQYFINVCGAGLLANVSQQIDTQFKDSLGKLAYYLKGIGQLPNFMPVPLRIMAGTQSFVDEFFLFLVLNGGGAGGFDRLSTTAKIDDGMLDFIGFKAMNMIDVAALFLKVIAGDYLDDRRVVFMREKELIIEHVNHEQIDTDTDGERGPSMPLNISCKKESLQLFVPPTYR